MRGLPKVHKKDIGIRAIDNGKKNSVLEKLKEEMAKVFNILNDRQNKKIIKDSDELVEEWKETIIGKQEIMFSLDVEKMFSNIKRQSVLEEIERMIDKNERIRDWKKEEILENLQYI
jgi:hypothetical protein